MSYFVCVMYIHSIKYIKIEMEEKTNFFLYSLYRPFALSNGEQRNNFNLVKLLPCLYFRVTTQAAM